MNKRFHKTRALIAAMLTLSPAVAYAEGQLSGGLPPASFSRSGRQFTYVVPSLRTQTSPASATCTITTGTVTADLSSGATYDTSQGGRDGFVWYMDFASVSSIDATTGFAAISYPSRLMIDFYDASSNGTLTCTGATVTGYRWDGERVVENVTRASALQETTTTPRYTDNAFSAIARIQLTGCSGGASGDLVRIRVSPWVALPRRVLKSSDIDSVCVSADNSGFTVQTAGYSFVGCLPGSSFTYDFPSNSIYVLNNLFRAWLTGSTSSSSCQQDRLTTTIRGRASPLGGAY
jgi:hypothetical protein